MNFFEDTVTAMRNLSTQRLLSNNKFIVTIGPLLTSFSKISGISKSVDYETREEGGRNDFVHVIRKNTNIQSNILTLEKGVGRFNPLILSSNGMIKMGTKIPLPGTIIVLNNYNVISKVYGFEDIRIMKWEVSELDAKGSEILLDRVELIHSGLITIGI